MQAAIVAQVLGGCVLRTSAQGAVGAWDGRAWVSVPAQLCPCFIDQCNVWLCVDDKAAGTAGYKVGLRMQPQ